MAYLLYLSFSQNQNVESIVAPFEADAQLSYLGRIKYVDFIITEDSDLLAFGTPRILFKLQEDGWGEEISFDDLTVATEQNMSNFSPNTFLTTCIMAGCDYLENIDKVGFKTAFKFV
jgi:exonuclease-1